MTGLIRKLRWGGDPDRVNEISGLTLRDVHAVQSSWAVVHAEPAKYGLEVFRRLFRADPEARTFFKTFGNLSDEDLASNPQFRAHAINFMASINQAVSHLKEPSVVIVMMNKLGTSHGKRQVRRKHFSVAREVLVSLLTELKLSNEVMTSWDKCINFLFQHIYVKLDNPT